MASSASALACGVLAARRLCGLGGGNGGFGLARIGLAYSPTTSVRSDGLMFSRTPLPSTHSPLM